MPFAFTKPFLMHNTTYTERVCRLQHYSQVVAAYITLQTICNLTESIIGLLRAHSDGVAYHGVAYLCILLQKSNVSRNAECFELYHCN